MTGMAPRPNSGGPPQFGIRGETACSSVIPVDRRHRSANLFRSASGYDRLIMTNLMSRSEAVKRVRVAALDTEHSLRRCTVLIGPLKLPPLGDIVDRYNALADLGPPARLCLQPASNTNRWTIIRVDGSDVITSTDPLVPGVEPTRLIARVRAMRTHGCGDGIRVLRAGDHLAIDFNHGLGDVQLIRTLVDVLVGVVAPQDLKFPRQYGYPSLPLLNAGLRTFGSDPRRVAELLSLYRQRPRPAAPYTGVDSSTPRFTGSSATRFVGFPAEFVAELRRRRDATMPGVSLMALCTYALWESLVSVGLEVDDTVKIPFDVSRYLGTRSGTLASTSAGLDFEIGGGRGPAQLQADMDRSASSGRPVANLLVSSLKASWSRPEVVEPHPLRPRVRLLHSNVMRAVRTHRWPFTDRAAARTLVASDPMCAEGVTVTSTWTLGNLCLTAEFHDNVFDADQIGTALTSVGTRMHNLIDK